MLNFLARFCPSLSDVVKALRELTYKDVPFQWTDSHDKAFVESKKLIAQGPVLGYFYSQLPTTLQVGVSNVGVGERFLQNDQPVAFASNTLQVTEQFSTVTGKESLAVYSDFENWNSLLYGKSNTNIHSKVSLRNLSFFAHSWEILSALENKIRIPARPFNVLYRCTYTRQKPYELLWIQLSQYTHLWPSMGFQGVRWTHAYGTLARKTKERASNTLAACKLLAS